MWETIPVLKEALVELILERSTFKTWVFVADITDDFILGLDVLQALDALVDLWAAAQHDSKFQGYYSSKWRIYVLRNASLNLAKLY
jgi:hypothetical protein